MSAIGEILISRSIRYGLAGGARGVERSHVRTWVVEMNVAGLPRRAGDEGTSPGLPFFYFPRVDQGVSAVTWVNLLPENERNGPYPTK